MKTILIVEDDEPIGKSVQELLVDEGYLANLVENGQLALDRLKAGAVQPDLIILDLMMPVMGGLEFCSHQKNDPTIANIPVIVMSANAHFADECKQAGAKAFMKKPVDITYLLEMVKLHSEKPAVSLTVEVPTATPTAASVTTLIPSTS